MKTINYFFSKKLYHSFSIASIMLLSFLLLSARIAITKTSYFLFLVWNIFLAIIPYLITMYAFKNKSISKILLIFAFLVWFAFLPNAPYIITDLYHLKSSTYRLIWLDTLVITSFAITGMLLFYKSLTIMLELIKTHFNFKYEKLLAICICFLSAFGIYIGRFMRYNSWDILNNPKSLFIDVFNILLKPKSHTDAWLFTICFGLFLSIVYWTYTVSSKLKTKY